jgi:carbon-monoxide dehydrogenase medium subunit
MMNFRLSQPGHLIDINSVGELSYARCENGMLAVGATARQAAVEHSIEVRSSVPLLAEALHYVAHPPIRHRGTVAGSIAHADPAAELPAVAIALGATITLVGAQGSRVVTAEDFFLGPFETAVVPGEMITEVRFPVAAPGSGHAFVEFARRHGDFAIAGAAVTLRLEGERVADASIALCAAGPRPHPARAAADMLRGAVPDDALLAAVADRSVEDITPGADIHGGTHYRIAVARAQVQRALVRARDRARGSRS